MKIVQLCVTEWLSEISWPCLLFKYWKLHETDSNRIQLLETMIFMQWDESFFTPWYLKNEQVVRNDFHNFDVGRSFLVYIINHSNTNKLGSYHLPFKFTFYLILPLQVMNKILKFKHLRKGFSLDFIHIKYPQWMYFCIHRP